MRLARLESYGFKSFAERIRIDFDEGITAIVGPNGCGKSNVSDAIRWILGESSMRVLRGERLDDVIFKGTRDRKPLSVAEATLHFTGVRDVLGVDYEDLSVTRRVFRDGVSDFFINKVPCRLKDIQDLFLDTGMGKGAYSVMEGRLIDQIVSSNSYDRRALFEQAAGVMRYKDRRRLTHRKLEEVEGNLERLGDVIGEVEKNVRSLSYQVRKARRYRRIKHEITLLEVHAARVRWDDYTSRLATLLSQEKGIQDRAVEREVALGKADAALENLRMSTSGRLEALRTREEALAEARAAVSSLEREGVVNRERAAALEVGSRRCELESEELEERVASIEKACVERVASARALEEPLAGARAVLAGGMADVVDRRAREDEIRSEVEALRAEVLEDVEARAALETDRSVIEARREAVIRQAEVAQDRRIELENERNGAEADGIRLGEELEAARERVTEADASLGTLETERASIREERDGCRTSIEDLRGRQEAAQARVEVIRGLEARLEGYGRSVRELISGEVGEGIQGVLASLVDVRPGSQRAIEAVLGDRLQAVLTTDTKTARLALGRVYEQGWGRVALLPQSLSDGNRSASGESVPAGDGILGLAVDHVSPRSGVVAGVVAGLLDRVALVRDLDVALARLEDSRDPGWTYVTPAGDVVCPGGLVLSGSGADDEADGLLARRQKIADAEREARSLEKDLEEVRAAVSVIDQRLTALDAEIIEARANRDAARERIHRIEADSRRATEQVEACVHSLEALVVAEGEQVHSLEESEARMKGLVGRLQETKDGREERSEFLRGRETALMQATQVRETIEREMAAAQVDVTRIEGEERNLAAMEAHDRDRLEEMRARIARLAEERGSATQDLAELSDASKQLVVRLGDAVDSEKDRAEAASSIRSEVSEVQDEIRGLEEVARTARRELEAAREELHGLQINQVEINTGREGLRERILRDHRLDLENTEMPDASEALETAPEDGEEEADTGGRALPDEMDFSEVENPEEKLESLRNQLDRLGDVNVLAIEQHDEEDERLQFLLAQRQDLVDARASLEETIEKIDTTAREAFLETFEEVRGHFRELFSTLFVDGEADVFLEEDVDPLQAGVDIIARPGGKRPQRITLLSSGEKAMTAIALLFALFRVRPSPFCLLDEIDAPLDDANILRFVHLLREFAKDSQFLVITHNKRTMEAAGTLFGITMEEVGISKIVSLSLGAERPMSTEAVTGKAARTRERQKVPVGSGVESKAETNGSGGGHESDGAVPTGAVEAAATISASLDDVIASE